MKSVKVSIFKVLLILLLAIIAVALLSISHKLARVTQTSKPQAIIPFKGWSQEESIPKSNIEWFQGIGLKMNDFMESLLVDAKYKGEVVAIKEGHDKWKIASKYYYVGEPGYYYYDGEISLKSSNGRVQVILFSPKRMEFMKVTEVGKKGTVTRKFGDIKVGDNIELEETVDLKQPNQNDDNLVSIGIKILK